MAEEEQQGTDALLADFAARQTGSGPEGSDAATEEDGAKPVADKEEQGGVQMSDDYSADALLTTSEDDQSQLDDEITANETDVLQSDVRFSEDQTPDGFASESIEDYSASDDTRNDDDAWQEVPYNPETYYDYTNGDGPWLPNESDKTYNNDAPDDDDDESSSAAIFSSPPASNPSPAREEMVDAAMSVDTVGGTVAPVVTPMQEAFFMLVLIMAAGTCCYFFRKEIGASSCVYSVKRLCCGLCNRRGARPMPGAPKPDIALTSFGMPGGSARRW